MQLILNLTCSKLGMLSNKAVLIGECLPLEGSLVSFRWGWWSECKKTNIPVSFTSHPAPIFCTFDVLF